MGGLVARLNYRDLSRGFNPLPTKLRQRSCLRCPLEADEAIYTLSEEDDQTVYKYAAFLIYLLWSLTTGNTDMSGREMFAGSASACANLLEFRVGQMPATLSSTIFILYEDRHDPLGPLTLRLDYREYMPVWYERPDPPDVCWLAARALEMRAQSVIVLTMEKIRHIYPLSHKTMLNPPGPRVTNTKLVTTGTLNSIPVDACPDTGACINAISYDLVQRQNWTFKKSSDLSPVKLPGNGFCRPLGTIELPWIFEGESTTYNLAFHVLPKCVHPIILGRKFLKSSETVGKHFARRIKKKTVNSLSLKRLCRMGTSHERSWGFLMFTVPEH